ncbi:hypothetical protein DFH09DRAFT_1333257 [Mycena vulgaris]|nr:hypothetical protein DFH09DRAFT_1333257 [Mycena vulgaris]
MPVDLADVRLNWPWVLYKYWMTKTSVNWTNAELVISARSAVGALRVAVGILTSRLPNSTDLFQLYKSSVVDHAYAATADDVHCLEAAGYGFIGTERYVYTTQICNSVPLYGLFLASGNDHFYTTSISEKNSAINSGYIDLGITAYVIVPGIINGGDTC